MSQKLYNMKFSSVYPALIEKVERKGGRAESVHQVTSWLTGYEVSDLLLVWIGTLPTEIFFDRHRLMHLNGWRLQGRFVVFVLRKLTIL